MQEADRSEDGSRHEEQWHFDGGLFHGDPMQLEARPRVPSAGRFQIDLAAILAFIAVQELAFALLYDVIRGGRRPNLILAAVIGVLVLVVGCWHTRTHRKHPE